MRSEVDKWWNQALCAEIGPELWWAGPEDSERSRKQAREICARCPVQNECLESAMEEERGQDFTLRATIRGGLTPLQRYRLEEKRGTCADCGCKISGGLICPSCAALRRGLDTDVLALRVPNCLGCGGPLSYSTTGYCTHCAPSTRRVRIA